MKFFPCQFQFRRKEGCDCAASPTFQRRMVQLQQSNRFAGFNVNAIYPAVVVEFELPLAVGSHSRIDCGGSADLAMYLIG